ncbi:hypothetical protein ACLO87_03700 [Paenalcaligenes sp. Me52]|uniref:hypothetical protein n=1 Tax=Paenalcaligenes sp. Me52 TaxID=3392038 RepID=UPI003D2AC993
MISRLPVVCSTCNDVFALRVQIGHLDKQEHKFKCLRCKEPMTLVLDLSEGVVEIESFSGLSIYDGDGASLETLFLSSDFIVNEEDSRNPFFFPSIREVNSLIKDRGLADFDSIGGKFISYRDETNIILDFWGSISSAYRLYGVGEYFLSSRKIEGVLGNDSGRKKGIDYALCCFHKEVYGDSGWYDFVKKTYDKNSVNFRKFLCWYSEFIKKERMDGIFSILNEYFKNFKYHREAFIYVKNSREFPENGFVTSDFFDDISKYYASAFEERSKQLVVLTAFNNILNGRDFDSLENIDLYKYSKSDAAKKRNNLVNNDFLYNETSEYDSKLRNAIYHGWIRHDTNKNSLMYKSSEGSSDFFNLSVAEYIFKCGVITRQISGFGCVVFYLNDIMRKNAYVLKDLDF